MLLRPAEFTHASEKFEFTTKEFGARGAGRSLRRCRCPYHFVSWAAVANQLAAAWMWLAGAMPLSTVHSNSLLYFSVILRNPWFSLGNNKCFWKENEKLYCENYWQCFRKMTKVGYFLEHMTYWLVTFHRMWPHKYGSLYFAILECSLNVWIVNKTVFAAPELREKCAVKSEVLLHCRK